MKPAIVVAIAVGIVAGIGFLWMRRPPPGMARPALAPGQRWSYRTRADEPGSTLVILMIEETPARGRIVHVRFEGVRIPASSAGAEPVTTIGHAPIAESALIPGLIAVVETGCEIGDMSGYGIWKEAFDAGKAGVFSISPAEVVGVTGEAASHR